MSANDDGLDQTTVDGPQDPSLQLTVPRDSHFEESLFREALDAVPFGFCAMRIIRDGPGDAVDLEWRYQNAAAAGQNRLPVGYRVKGHRLLATFPRLEQTALWEACKQVATEGGSRRVEHVGEYFEGSYRISVSRTTVDSIALMFEDVTEAQLAAKRRAEDAAANEVLLRVANLLADLDVQSVVQKVTDEATKICRAQFGAFFYNVNDARGERYMLWTISGVPRSHFESFPMPRNTEIFAPTFSGERIVRSEDILADPRYGKNHPYYGMPKGHLPVRSYLAVPVVSRSGEVLGGLFFGHSERAVFTERDERTVVALAQQAAVAMDNARLFEVAEQERARAEEANRAKDEFLATISHELRTPLQAMLGWARMLKSGLLSEDKRERAIEAIERNVMSQVALIEDVLDVSRIITGKLRLQIEPVDLQQVVEAALDSVRPAVEAKAVRLQVVQDPDAGPISGDPNRLQQVVWNLLSNAVKFTPKGGRVLVTVQRENSHVKIEVADTGQGIGQEFLPFVFERFRQADSKITRAHGGLGLGLAIVKHLTELHGGTVTAESLGPDQGATFTVRLPVAPLRNTPTEGLSQPASNAGVGTTLGCPPNLAGLKILLVDDQPDARELLATILEHCDARVTLAGSCEEALLAFEADPPDVLVSDIGMPGEDGLSLIRRVRALPPERGGRTPSIALTAYARSQDRTRALAHGFDHHVAKPVEPSELLVVIANLVGRYQGASGPDGSST